MTTRLHHFEGQPADLDKLFRQYHRDLDRLAYRKLGDREAASDLVQDAFTRLLAHLQTGGAPESPRFFLWRIARNLIIDALRRDRRRGLAVSLDELKEELVDSAPSVERRLVAQQEFCIIRQALDELAPKTRTALLLNRVEGLSHAEIAAQLGISPSMVSKHILNALRHCVSRLDMAGH